MKRFLLLLVPAALFAGQARYARLGEFDGKVEVQLHAADPWSRRGAQSAAGRIAHGCAPARPRALEIELDEGSAWRLGPGFAGRDLRLHAPLHRAAHYGAVAGSRSGVFHGRARRQRTR